MGRVMSESVPSPVGAVDARPQLRLGLVGYGVGGRFFHAPFIEAASGVELAGVVTRSTLRRAELAADYPRIPVYDDLEQLLAAGVDAVTITTPPQTRRELVLAAIAGGVHVIADKPFAPDAAGGRDLARAAEAAGVALNVFHNRRWDADIRTLSALLERGDLGDLVRVESRFDLDQPETLEPGPSGGLLRDLGSHLVDQMLWLLGPARRVYADLEWIKLADGRTDAGFAITITHTSGVRSHVSSTKCNRINQRELRAYGSAGGYVASGTDVQAQAIFAGLRPAELGNSWGYDAAERWGTLTTASGSVRVPSEQGAYQDYYSQFAAAVNGAAQFPVPTAGAIHTLEVLDAARTSADSGQVVELLDAPLASEANDAGL
jgi:predicted dehydrogenase